MVDLADLNSVERGCQSWLAEAKPLDGLILNAGCNGGDQTTVFQPAGIELTLPWTIWPVNW